MIDGITDLDRFKAYRQAEKRHVSRNRTKARAHKYINKRERELDDDADPITVDPEPEMDSVTATDGGVELEFDENDDTGNWSLPQREAEDAESSRDDRATRVRDGSTPVG